MGNIAEIQERLQKIYNDNFSFLKFDESVVKDTETYQVVLFCRLSTYAAFDYTEIILCGERGTDLKQLMQVRLVDALIHIREQVNENIKQLKEIE